MTTLHLTPTLDDHLPHVHVGARGVGFVAVNAMSEELEIEVRREGWSWHQRFARGVPLGPLERGARTDRTGTRVRFRADRSIFRPDDQERQRRPGAPPSPFRSDSRHRADGPAFDRAAIRERLQQLAAFNPNVIFELMTERIQEPRGLEALLYSAASNRCQEIDDVFVLPGQVHESVFVEVALAWTKPSQKAQWTSPWLRSFVGQSETEDGGTHESGFWRGLTKAIRSLGDTVLTGRSANRVVRSDGIRRNATRIDGPNLRLPRRAFRASRRMLGLHAIVHVDLRDPRFGAPTRSRLSSREVERVVQRVVTEAYAIHLSQHPSLAHRLRSRFS